MFFRLLLFLSLPFMLHTHKPVGETTCSYMWDFMLHCSLAVEENIFVLPFLTEDLKFTESINVLYIYLWQEGFKYF